MLVGESPDCEANAAGADVEARSYHVGVVDPLLSSSLRAGREAGVADVDLGVGHVDVESREAAKHCGQGGPGRSRADNHVALEADSVDGGACSLDDLDKLDSTVRLGLVVLEVVVVVVAGKPGEVRSLLVRSKEAVQLGTQHHKGISSNTYSFVFGSAALAALKERGMKSVPKTR